MKKRVDWNHGATEKIRCALKELKPRSTITIHVRNAWSGEPETLRSILHQISHERGHCDVQFRDVTKDGESYIRIWKE